jgi:hypothetical protein
VERGREEERRGYQKRNKKKKQKKETKKRNKKRRRKKREREIDRDGVPNSIMLTLAASYSFFPASASTSTPVGLNSLYSPGPGGFKLRTATLREGAVMVSTAEGAIVTIIVCVVFRCIESEYLMQLGAMVCEV